MKWFIYALYSWEDIISYGKNNNFWDLCNKRPLRGHLLDRGRLTQNSIQRGASIRYGAFIGSWVFIRSFTVSTWVNATPNFGERGRGRERELKNEREVERGGEGEKEKE